MTSADGSRARLTDVGAVIVTHNRVDAAVACAAAVSREVDRASIIVVVNDPADGDADLDQLRAVAGQVVINDRPAGYGANLNAGAALVSAEACYLLLLNDDALVADGAVGELRRALEEHPDAALAGAQLVDPDGARQPSVHPFPTLASELAGAMLLPAALEGPIARRFVDARQMDIERGDAWPVGAALLVHAGAFREVGGFDERYFLYSEETDLARRLRNRGWGIAFAGRSLVTHVGAQSTGGRHQRLLGLSRWRYARSHWSKPSLVALVVLLPIVYLWNALYVGVRVLLSPSSARDKVHWWYGRWVKRPLPDLHLPQARRPAGVPMP